MSKKLAPFVALMLAACNTGAPVPAGNAALSITKFEVTQTATMARIDGLGSDGKLIGSVQVERRFVSIPSEDLEGDGRALSVDVNGHRADHLSVGTAPLTLPLPQDPGAEISTFLSDANVAPVLAQVGVSFSKEPPQAQPATASGERPLSTCTFGFNSACGMTSCSEYSWNGNIMEDVCCSSVGDPTNSSPAVDNRVCIPGAGAGVSTACGATGGKGCAVCWWRDFSNSCSLAACGAGGVGWTLDWSSTGVDGCTPNCTGLYSCGKSNGCGGYCPGNCAGGQNCWDNGPAGSGCGEWFSCFAG